MVSCSNPVYSTDLSGPLRQQETDDLEPLCGQCFNEEESEEVVKDSQERECLTQNMAIMSAVSEESNVSAGCFNNNVLNVSPQCDNMRNEIPIRYCKGTYALSRNLRGSFKRKNRFSSPVVRRSLQMKRPYDESMDEERDITVAERLQLLFKSDSSPIHASNKTVDFKFTSGCVPMAERLQELFYDNKCFSESEAKDSDLRLVRNMTSKIVASPLNKTNEKVLPADYDIASSDNNEEEIEINDSSARDDNSKSCYTVKENENITCRMPSHCVVNPVSQTLNEQFRQVLLAARDNKKYSCMQHKPKDPIMASHYIENPVVQSLNEQFQEALLAAPGNEENSYIQEKPKWPIFGFASRLQIVLQHEKMERSHFMKAVQIRKKSYDERCLDVKIVKRKSLGRLASCSCNVARLPKDWTHYVNTSTLENCDMSSIMAIFNTRTNPDLELEVGCVIRIHPPWQEILTTTGIPIVILCTYYCYNISQHQTEARNAAEVKIGNYM